MSIDGLAPRTGEAYTDMRLVSVQSSTQQEKYIVTLVYETLGDNFVQVKDDTVSYTESGLRRVTRESIAKAGTSFQKTVGTTSISSQIDGETAVTCILASYEVDDTDSYREVTEVYVQSGVLSRNISQRNGGATGTGKLRIEVVEAFNETPTNTIGGVKIGDEVSNVEGIPTKRFTFANGSGQIKTSTRPGRIDGTTEVTAVSYGTKVVPSGVLISSSETLEDGYTQFTNTCIQGQITGTKQIYKDVVAVDVPGEVTCAIESGTTGAGGTIAIVQVTPRRSKRVSATVTIEVTTTSPAEITPAYDLGSISCSVTTKRESFNIFPGFLETNQSYSLSANTQTYPGCFLRESSSEGLVEYSSKVRREGSDATSTVKTTCVGFGSIEATEWTETGILKRKSRPLLTALNGTTYYEVITWSV